MVNVALPPAVNVTVCATLAEAATLTTCGEKLSELGEKLATAYLIGGGHAGSTVNRASPKLRMLILIGFIAIYLRFAKFCGNPLPSADCLIYS